MQYILKITLLTHFILVYIILYYIILFYFILFILFNKAKIAAILTTKFVKFFFFLLSLSLSLLI